MICIVLYGHTLSGKSQIAETFVAQNESFKIVNCDAYQIYKELPILTAAENIVLSQFYSVYEKSYSVGKFISDVQNLPQDQNYIFVGGTGMYASVLKDGIHELPNVSARNLERATQMYNDGIIDYEYRDPNNRHRVIRDHSFFLETGFHLKDYYERAAKIYPLKQDVIFVSVESVNFDYGKIEDRLNKMIEKGLFEEVSSLRYEDMSDTSRKVLGLNEVREYLSGAISLNEMKEKMFIATRQLMKKQKTWMRGQCLNESTRLITLDEFYRLKSMTPNASFLILVR